MQNVLIDDRRIHVDFSQSVSKLHGAWNAQRKRDIDTGEFGENLHRRQRYRMQSESQRGEEYGLLFEHGDSHKDDERRQEKSSRRHRDDSAERRRRNERRDRNDDRPSRQSSSRDRKRRSRSRDSRRHERRDRSRSPPRRHHDRR